MKVNGDDVVQPVFLTLLMSVWLKQIRSTTARAGMSHDATRYNTTGEKVAIGGFGRSG